MHPKLRGKEFYALFLLALLGSAPLELSQASPQATSIAGGGSGRIAVQVREMNGSPLIDAILTLYTDTLFSTGIRPTRRSDGFEFQGVPPGRYVIEATAGGFQPGRRNVEVFGPTQTEVIMFFLKPLGAKGEAPPVPESAAFTPKAQKETQTALRDLQSKKYQNAQKHLDKALKASPGNAQVHFLMGMTHVLTGRAPEARSYLEKALSLDPRHLQSLMALGNLRYKSEDHAGAKEMFDRALAVSPVSWQAHSMLAKCQLQLRDYLSAREHAQRALELGREKAVGVQLHLAQALAGLGEYSQASGVLSAYLQEHPQDPSAETIRGWIADLDRAVQTAAKQAAAPAAASIGTADLASADALPAAPSMKDSWAPPDADATVPPVAPGTTCELSQVLTGASRRTEELVTHLERFSALERYESVEIGAGGQVSNPVSAAFSYLVFIRKTRPDLFTVEEVREQNKAAAALPGYLQDMGSPAIVLMFHPLYQDDFDMKCEGLGQWNGQANWLVHLKQRKDRPVRLRSFVAEQRAFPVRLRGRAWISAESYQVVHVETDLLEPVPDAQLRREHMSVDYKLVAFPDRKVELWLPHQVDLYHDFRGRFYHHYHTFSDFRLFAVDVNQQIGHPKERKPQP